MEELIGIAIAGLESSSAFSTRLSSFSEVKTGIAVDDVAGVADECTGGRDGSWRIARVA